MDDIKREVRRYIEDNFIMGASGPAIADGDSFLEHHVLDSTGFLELIAFLEEAYGIRVGDDEMTPENLDTLDAVGAFVAGKRKAVQA